MVRWVVAGEVFTDTFASYVLADGFRSELIQAMNGGEAFDIATGLPVAKLEESAGPEPSPEISWLEFGIDYVRARWPEVAAKTRDSISDSLATVTPVMVESTHDRPAELILQTIQGLNRSRRPAAFRGAQQRGLPQARCCG